MVILELSMTKNANINFKLLIRNLFFNDRASSSGYGRSSCRLSAHRLWSCISMTASSHESMSSYGGRAAEPTDQLVKSSKNSHIETEVVFRENRFLVL